jgi:hypothetical protein
VLTEDHPAGEIRGQLEEVRQLKSVNTYDVDPAWSTWDDDMWRLKCATTWDYKCVQLKAQSEGPNGGGAMALPYCGSSSVGLRIVEARYSHWWGGNPAITFANWNTAPVCYNHGVAPWGPQASWALYHWGKHTEIVGAACNGSHRCTVYANNVWLGRIDTCPNHHKILYVKYHCGGGRGKCGTPAGRYAHPIVVQQCQRLGCTC